MSPRAVRVAGAFAIACTFAVMPALLADDAKSDTKPAKPDFSKFTTVGDIVGEVVKADDKHVVVRISWYGPKNGNDTRPPINGNTGNYNRPGTQTKQNNNMVLQHHDYDIEMVTESQVRTKILPVKYDDKGKKVDYSAKEREDLKGPWNIPGYASTVADLTPGTTVDVTAMRDKSVKADKATDADLRVKYVIITQLAPTKTDTKPKAKS